MESSLLTVAVMPVSYVTWVASTRVGSYAVGALGVRITVVGPSLTLIDICVTIHRCYNNVDVRHFTIDECRHPANACTAKWGCIGLILYNMYQSNDM